MAPVIVMGVSGCGKTTFGLELARRLGLGFVEGDTLHPQENIDKMSAGIPLNDDDRWPWLRLISDAVSARGRAVASCSALKKAYRDQLRHGVDGPLAFVHLSLPRHELERRMQLRRGHFMPPGLLASQLATLERPDNEDGVLVIDGTAEQALNIDRTATWLGSRHWEKTS